MDEELLKEFGLFRDKVTETRKLVEDAMKHKNVKYIKALKDHRIVLNRESKFLLAKLRAIGSDSLSKKVKDLDAMLEVILTDKKYTEKLEVLGKLEMFWPELEVELEGKRARPKLFEVPDEIPMNESRLDLEEAIKDYMNDCFLSSLVLCRRSYEGALVDVYRVIEKRDPKEDIKCSCGKVIRQSAYYGISKLHRWAIEKKLVNDRLQQLGFLISDLGAGGAHPPLSDFPRDKEFAKVGITVTITLLSDLYRNEKKLELGVSEKQDKPMLPQKREQ